VNKNRPICFGIGQVCENHPNRTWDEKLGCMCGAGMPCECNRPKEPAIDPPDYSALITDIKEH
jgi:hypothetical protein